MSDTVRNDSNQAAPEKKSGANMLQILLIGAAVLAVAGLIAYQMFGCASCYG